MSAERRPSRVLKRQEKARQVRIKRALLCADASWALAALVDEGLSETEAERAYWGMREPGGSLWRAG